MSGDIIGWCVIVPALACIGFGMWQRGQWQAEQEARDEVQATLDRATIARAKRELIKARIG